MKRGIRFEVPNGYGNILAEVLKPFDLPSFCWKIGDGESYLEGDKGLERDLFPEGQTIMEGAELKNLLENNRHYVIFAELQAYPDSAFFEIVSYEEFVDSPCELVLLVVDCIYVDVYCKNESTIELLYDHANEHRYGQVAYITDENDTRTRLSVW